MNNSFFRWLAFVSLVWAIPAFCLWLGVGLHTRNVNRQKMADQFGEMEENLSDFFDKSRPEPFFERNLSNFFRNLNQEPRDWPNIASSCQKFRQGFPDEMLEIHLFDKSRKIRFGPRPELHGELEYLFAQLCRPGFNDHDFSMKNTPGLIRLMGNMYLSNKIMRNLPGKCVQLNRFLAEDGNATWAFWDRNESQGKIGGILVLIFKRPIPPGFCLKQTIAEFSSTRENMGFILSNGARHIPGVIPRKIFKQFLQRQKEEPQSRLQLKDYLGAFKTIDSSTFFVIEKLESQGVKANPIVFFVLLSLIFFIFSYRVIGSKASIPIGVSGKLLFFFGLGVGFPMAVSIALASFYLTEKESEVIQKTHQEDLRYLQALDSQFSEELTKKYLLYKRVCEKITKATNQREAIKHFLLKGYNNLFFDNFFAMSSSSVPISYKLLVNMAERRRVYRLPAKAREEAGLLWLKSGNILSLRDIKAIQGKPQPRIEEYEAQIPMFLKGLAVSGRVTMTHFNRKRGFPPLPEPKGDALLLNSFTDSNIPALLKSLYVHIDGLVFIDRSGGTYIFVDIIPGKNGSAEYFIFIEHPIITLERKYMEKIFSENRLEPEKTWIKGIGNQYDFSLYFPDGENLDFYKPLWERIQRTNQNVLMLHRTFNGKPVEVTVLNCSQMKHFCLFKVTTREKIQENLKVYRVRIFWGLTACAIFSFLLLWLFIRKLLVPVRDLAESLTAMQRKNFSFKIPARSNDELGILCETFNRGIEHLRKMEVGAVVQSAILPEKYLEIAPFLLEGENIMTQSVGGDYFDFIPLQDGKLAIILGDVSGHGLSSALVVAMAKAGFTTLCPAFPDRPDEVMNRISNAFLTILNKKKMMTCILGVLDPKSETLHFSNAGQNSPVLVQHDGTVSYLSSVAYPLGLKKNPQYQTGLLDPIPQTIVLYSDGLVEARDFQGNEIGYDKFPEILGEIFRENGSISTREVFSRVRKSVGDAPFDDDTTCVILSRRPALKYPL